MLLLLLACGAEPTPADAEAAPAGDAGDADPACEPTVSWAGWGAGFFRTWCGACHSATTPDRRGAPEGLNFDSAAEVAAHTAAIERSVLSLQSMPVGGGVDADSLTALAAYLACVDPLEVSEPVVLEPPVHLDALELGARVEAVLGAGLPRADHLFLAYVDLLYAHGGDPCPSGWREPLHDYHAPIPGCTTPEGWVFAGLTLRAETLEPDGVLQEMDGDGFVQSPTGGWGVLGGELFWWRAEGEAPVAWWQSVHGTWGWDWGEGWLALTPSMTLDLSGVWEADRQTATLDGGLSADGLAIFLEAVTLDTAACPGAPTGGRLSVRDDVGYWYPVELRADCSGCGDAADPTGAPIGELCPDWGPVLDSLALPPG
jgi:hypothetical protein